MPQIGDTLLHYQIQDLLGQGGMGQVFKAYDSHLNRQVALKCLLPHLIATPLRDRLLREAHAVAALDHPHIGVLYGIEEHENLLFLVMALYQGETLEHKLVHGLTLEQGLDIFRQLLQAVSHAHQKGVIHRDIKPANIFITDDNQVKLLDFGLAKLDDAGLTRQGELLGTPLYASPEQLRGEEVDQRSDIWSLGVVLFQLLTGALPFEGKFPQIIASIMRDTPKSLGQFMQHEVLQQIVESCLAKDKQERFSHCEALQQALERSSSATTPRPTTTTASFSRSGARRSEQLVGRESEIAELIDLLYEPSNDLISIVGIGGAGKSSLAKAITSHQDLAPRFPDGVFWVPLEALREADHIPYEIANTLDVHLSEQQLWHALAQALASKRCLLILDNLEHLAHDCVLLLEQLLQTCPQLTLLVTSREVLNITGEVIFELTGLSIPQSLKDDFYSFGASRLFIEKARRLKRNFDAEQEKEAILSICQQLEGWPLGLELAVSWVRHVPLQDIATKLKAQHDFLQSRTASAITRHQSARAAFEYSWQLLNNEEQTGLAKLAIFQGGCDSDAAFHVAATTLTTLASLLDKSLVTLNAQNRYVQHPLLHSFALEKLNQSEDVASIACRHAHYFLELAETAKTALISEQAEHWFGRLESEHDNLCAVLHWSLTQRSELGLQLAVAIDRFWENRGYISLAREWFARLLAKDINNDTLKAEASANAGWLALCQGDYAAAQQLSEQCLGLARAAGDQQQAATSLHTLGNISYEQGQLGQAYSLIQESLTLRRHLDDQQGTAVSLLSLAKIAEHQGYSAEAEALVLESYQLSQKAGDLVAEGICLNYLGDFASRQQRTSKAKALYQQSLARFQHLGDQMGIAGCLVSCAHLIAPDVPEKSISLFAAAQQLFTRSDFSFDPYEAALMRDKLSQLQSSCDQQTFEQAWQRGTQLSLDEMLAWASEHLSIEPISTR